MITDHTLGYVLGLADQVEAIGPSVLRMIRGELDADPTVAVPIVGMALAVMRAEPLVAPHAGVAVARELALAVRTGAGRAAVRKMIVDLDLGVAGDLDPDETDVEQIAHLDELVLTGLVAELVDGGSRVDIEDLLARNGALVLFEPEHFDALYAPAMVISNALDLPGDHPVHDLLDTIVAALENARAPEVEVDMDRVRAEAEAALPCWARLRQLWSGLGRRLADVLGIGDAPILAHAATATVRWPPPRIVLARRGADEASLVVTPGAVLVEWFGDGPPPSSSGLTGGRALAPASGPLPDARYWHLEPPSHDEAIRMTWADGGDWTVPLSPEPDVPEIPAPPRLDAWHAAAPGSLAGALRAHAARLRSSHRAWARHFELEAERCASRALDPIAGRAWFPVVFDGGGPPGGALAVVDCGRLGAGHDPASRVGAWVGALADAPEHPHLASLTVHIVSPRGTEVRGDSSELAQAVAMVSALLERAPRRAPVLSARLGASVGEVVAIDDVEVKRGIVSLEAPGAWVRIVDGPVDARPWLGELFGGDWQEALRRALGVDGVAHARAAVRAWHLYFRDHSVASLAVARDRALHEAERALAAGVGGLGRAQAIWVRGAMRLHRGETRAAFDDLAAARTAFERLDVAVVERFTLEECDAYLGIALVDVGCPSDAMSLLAPAIAALDKIVEGGRDRRWHLVRIQVAGTLQRAQAATGDLDGALATLRTSLETSHLPAERARSLMDLAELERRNGAFEAGRHTLRDARAHLDEILDEGARARSEQVLRLYEARAGVRSPDAPIGPPDWRRWPQPVEVLDALLAGPHGGLERWLDEHVLGALGSIDTVWLMVLLGALGRATGASRAATPNLLSAAEAVARELASRDGLDAGTSAAANAVIDPTGRTAALVDWARRAPY